MSLTLGSRLGPYEITAPIGAGGMGEVFRARDTKLNRDVAIKVLPAAFADDPERLARFTREAQTLASLNHPNIAAIYGIEEIASSASSDDRLAMTTGAPSDDLVAMTKGAGASRALVMELVEGEDLSAHIARGPIPIVEALPIARQIAEALEAAHEQGIVHRDLKPANIKVRTDGTVKVLDFGLAKAMDPAGASSANPNVSHSPTLTHQGTSAGMIIGTAAYMSPEQAKGKTVDKRADIWAFGVVLFEMLTGTRLFKGEDVSDTLAAVLRQDVDIAALPADTPPSVRRLIARCLDRDLKRRLRDIGEARLILDNPASPLVSEAIAAGASGGTASGVRPAAPWRRALPWGIAAAATLLAVASWMPGQPAPAAAPRKLLASIGADASLTTDRGASAILSPDGTTLAFAAQQGGQTRLFIRKLDQLEAAPLAGTEDAAYPFFSPDGQWIAFFASGKLKKISVAGGAVVSLCSAKSGRGGTWTDDDTIIFSPDTVNSDGLLRVSAAGGMAAPFGTLSQGATTQRWPDALPGGKAVIYTEAANPTNFAEANLVVVPIPGDPSAKAGPSKVVVPGAYYGRYVPSGHLIYIKEGALFAAPFDASRLEITGPAAPAIDGLLSSVSSGGAQVAFSSEGTAVFVPGAVTSNLSSPIHWMARDGKTSVLRATRAQWVHPRFSPDGQRVALDISDGKQRDIWVYEIARDTLTQLTFDPGNDTVPVWTPDGKRIAFGSDRGGKPFTRSLYWVNSDGTGEVMRLTESPDDQRPLSWHPSGKFLAFATASGDVLILPMEGDAARGLRPGTPATFLATPSAEYAPMFSPDGRFIAYMGNESGGTAYDLYVRPFPGPGGPWRISTDGGIWPRWSRTAPELLYMSGDKVMVAPYAVVGDSFRADKPRLWSKTPIRSSSGDSYYDLHPDGKRLAVAATENRDVVRDHVVFAFNFFDYLRKIAPAKK